MGKRCRRSQAVLSACALAVVLVLNSRLAIAQVSVSSATPNNAPQGTTALNVTVAGSGFENRAKATWFVSGTTNPGGVTVNSTTFVSSTQLLANITVAGNATTGSYDISVKNSNGRTGVGSDAFTVNPEAVTSSLYSTDTSGGAVTVQGDGLATNSSGASTYENTPSTCSTYSTAALKTCITMSLLPNDWYLRLGNQTYRTIRLTFIPLGGSPNESGLDGTYPAALATRCFDSNNNRLSIPLAIPPGTSNNRCSLIISFSANGTTYDYDMGPLYSGTGWSTVTCISGTGTETCNNWTITPTPATALPNPSLANVANLYKVAKSGKMTLIGTYTMTFNIALTLP